MFELLFKYPAAVFSKGQLVFLGRWPVWLLGIGILAAAASLGWLIYHKRQEHASGLHGLRPAAIWVLQTLFVIVLLFMLWQPAVSIATLRPQQNVVAVVIDDSKSMAQTDTGKPRRQEAIDVLNGGLLNSLQKRFQVRLYRGGNSLQRLESLEKLNSSVPSTHLGETLKEVMAEASNVPVGAVVLLSDGADNSGGLDLETMNEIKRQRIPIHTIGFGKEKPERDAEIGDVQLPARALADSRLNATVAFHQSGYTGQQARLTIKDAGKVIASSQVLLKSDGLEQIESIPFNAGTPGARTLRVSIEPLAGEENVTNNSVNRLLIVDNTKPRVLYIEGEPRWEYKFIRRAADLDHTVQLVSILRTTQNKIYRQGIGDPKELEEGFPTSVDELFAFQGLIIGGVEANYFTPAQQELIKQFADRRGGGVLFLGGRFGLSESGVNKSPLADILPTILPDKKNTFHRDPATVELTSAGRDSLLCRIEENPDRNVERWKKLPYLANFQEVGTPKPGAVVLAEMNPGGRGKLPLLVTQNYGRGRTAIFATAGSWRWQMLQPVEDMSHEVFWQQMMRWLVTGTQGRVVVSTQKSVFPDETKVQLRAEVRDANYAPSSDARVEAHILGPEGFAENVEMQPDPTAEGVYTLEFNAEKQGSYVAEALAKRGEKETGRDVVTFRREDGVAENFHTQQNRELLEKLASQTGGRYLRPTESNRLADEISYSEAGISVKETHDLWDMPALFLVALVLRSGEWLLRRKWGVV